MKIQCSSCKGNGWIVELYPDNTFATVRCSCVDFLPLTRLTEQEQLLTIDDIEDREVDDKREMLTIRFLCKRMIEDPRGFLSFAGTCGSAKSLAVKALVATLARNGKEARYFTMQEIVRKIMPFRTEDGRQSYEDVPGDLLLAMLKRLPVLAIDEMDKATWSHFVADNIGEVIDHRHRNADKLVTIFAMNAKPDQWFIKPGVNLAYIISRMTDGSFNRLWPERFNAKVPPCIADNKQGNRFFAPGLFETTLSDIRPMLDAAD